MIRRLVRCIQRWHHRQMVKDCEFELRTHKAHQRDLPAEIERVDQRRKFHQGRADTLSEPRSPVNFHLARPRSVTVQDRITADARQASLRG